jgi:hypothetical protein
LSVDPAASPGARLRWLAARVAVRAEAMGLAAAGSGVEERPAVAVLQVLDTARGAGIGRAIAPPADLGDERRMEAVATALLEAMEESPQPRAEWATLERVLGAELLARLVGVSESSLRRYASDQRATPDAVAARLHFVALVVGDLAGSYNDIGVRRWFERSRSQLDGRAPSAVLGGAWDTRDEGPTRVRELAASLLAAPAT